MNADKEIKKLERQMAVLKAKSHKLEARRKKTAFRSALAAVKKFGFDSLHELLEIADTAAVATSKRKRAKSDNAPQKSLKAKAGHSKSRKAKKSAPKKRTIKSRQTSRRIYGPKGVVPTEADPGAKIE